MSKRLIFLKDRRSRIDGPQQSRLVAARSPSQENRILQPARSTLPPNGCQQAYVRIEGRIHK
ncbi:hypothetical protein Mapa_003707 [Marchantia paleacea]|nr:hypothetical protein Mapa_003707 [Marchantia paleacea]